MTIGILQVPEYHHNAYESLVREKFQGKGISGKENDVADHPISWLATNEIETCQLAKESSTN